MSRRRPGLPGKPVTRHEPSESHGKPPTRHEGDASESRRRLRRFSMPASIDARYDYQWDLSSSGAQADVVLCLDRVTREPVAIKIYRPEAFGVDDTALYSLSEADPAYVVPFWLERDDQQVWEVQEYFPLGNLDDLVVRRGRGPQPDGFVRDVVRDVGEALDYLHALHISHRDLKPQNILVRAEDPLDCVLADFGLARVNVLSNAIGSVAGTYTYTSPEGIVGRGNKPNDWWGLGVIVHELLTGRHLFADHTGEGFLSETRVRAAFFEQTWSYDDVTDPRWRLLLDGLLSPAADRWDWGRISSWLAGGSPPVTRYDRAPDPAPSSRRPSFYDFASRRHTHPTELAATIRREFQLAVDHLAGVRIIDLMTWLHQTPVRTGADDLLANTRTGHIDPSRAAVELQLILDPSEAPVLRGRVLSAVSLNQAIAEATSGDTQAAEWIAALRRTAVLTVLSRYRENPRLSWADDALASWWAEIERLRTSAPWREAILARALDRSAPMLEGTLLAASLDDGSLQQLLADAQRVLSTLPDDSPRALSELRSASGAPSIPRAALGWIAAPAWLERRAHDEETARREQAQRAEESRQREERRRQEPQELAELHRQAKNRAAARRRSSDYRAVIAMIVTCVTVFAPWLVGRYLLRDRAFRPTGAGVFETAARDDKAYFVSDWSAGCVVVLLLAVAFLVFRPWRGRVASLVSAAVMLALVWLWFIPASTSFWRDQEQLTAGRLSSTAYPFGDHHLTCGSAEKGFGMSTVEPGRPSVTYALFSARTEDSKVKGCNRLEFYRGWRQVRVIDLKMSQEIDDGGGVSAPVTVNDANSTDKTEFTVRLASGRLLRYTLDELISG